MTGKGNHEGFAPTGDGWGASSNEKNVMDGTGGPAGPALRVNSGLDGG